MYCPDCRTHLPDDYAYCTNCGKDVKNPFTNEQETVLRATNIGSRIHKVVGTSDPQKKHSHGETANDGRSFVSKELAERGIYFVEQRDGRQNYLQVTKSDGRQITIRVKTKRNKGNWHSDTRFGEAASDPIRPEKESLFWAFVNLNDYGSEPSIWIVPDIWLRNDIWIAHHKYLAKRQGHRAKNNDSTHHSIEEKRLEQWQGRWDLLL